jgi:hypothetical protein
MNLEGFNTGIRSRFFHNGYSAWNVPKEGFSSQDPYICGTEELGNDRRPR